MASEWFYQVMGGQVGPVSSAELRNLAQRGTVKLDTPVRKAPDGVWVPAERVRGLFAVSNPTPPPIPVSATRETKTNPATPPEPTHAWNSLLIVTLALTTGIMIALVAGVVFFLHTRQNEAPQAAKDASRPSREGSVPMPRQSEALQAARDALKAIKQLQARTETGLTYSQYVEAVGNAWAEVKPFVESPEVSEHCGVRIFLIHAIDEYKDAIESWHRQVEIGDLSSEDAEQGKAMYERQIRACWKRAAEKIYYAEAMLRVSLKKNSVM